MSKKAEKKWPRILLGFGGQKTEVLKTCFQAGRRRYLWNFLRFFVDFAVIFDELWYFFEISSRQILGDGILGSCLSSHWFLNGVIFIYFWGHLHGISVLHLWDLTGLSEFRIFLGFFDSFFRIRRCFRPLGDFWWSELSKFKNLTIKRHPKAKKLSNLAKFGNFCSKKSNP